MHLTGSVLHCFFFPFLFRILFSYYWVRQLTIPSVGWTLIRAVLELTRDVDSVVCVAL